MTDRVDAETILTKEFIDNFDNTIPIAFSNYNEFILTNGTVVDKPTDSPWVRFLIQENVSNQQSFGPIGGRKFNRPGLISYQVFVPQNNGTYDSNIICELINNIFEGNRFGDVICETGTYQKIGINEGDMHQTNGFIEYHFDEIK